MTQPSSPETKLEASNSTQEPQLVDDSLMVTQALRVFVKRSARDDELIVARLGEDGSPPPGTRQALLVLLDTNEDLLQTKF